MQNYFSKLCSDSVINDKKFWTIIKPFMNSKGRHSNNNIVFIENGSIVNDKMQVSMILNDFYINIVKHITGNDND